MSAELLPGRRQLWPRIVDPLVLTTRLLYLRHGVARVGICALRRDEDAAARDERLHLGRARPDAVRRHEQQFENVWIGDREQLDCTSQAVENGIAALITHLVRRPQQIEVGIREQGKDATDIFVTGCRRRTVGATAGGALEDNRARVRFLQFVECLQSSCTSLSFTRTLSSFTSRVCLMMLGCVTPPNSQSRMRDVIHRRLRQAL